MWRCLGKVAERCECFLHTALAWEVFISSQATDVFTRPHTAGDNPSIAAHHTWELDGWMMLDQDLQTSNNWNMLDINFQPTLWQRWFWSNLLVFGVNFPKNPEL